MSGDPGGHARPEGDVVGASYAGLIAQTARYPGHAGDEIVGYDARPLGPGLFPGVVVIHHSPGWDESSLEVTRRFAHHGYHSVCPNLYSRVGHHDDPARAAAAVRQAGGISDEQVTGDVEGTVRRLRAEADSNGRVGIVGFCSGGRYAYLAACRLAAEAVVDCYGGGVIADPGELGPLRPVAPIELTADLSCPLLGIFGGSDPHVPPTEVAALQAELSRRGKNAEVHSYPDTGHAFLNPYGASYKVSSASDAWKRIFAFLEEHLHAPRTPDPQAP